MATAPEARCSESVTFQARPMPPENVKTSDDIVSKLEHQIKDLEDLTVLIRNLAADETQSDHFTARKLFMLKSLTKTTTATFIPMTFISFMMGCPCFAVCIWLVLCVSLYAIQCKYGPHSYSYEPDDKNKIIRDKHQALLEEIRNQEKA